MKLSIYNAKIRAAARADLNGMYELAEELRAQAAEIKVEVEREEAFNAKAMAALYDSMPGRFAA